MYCFMFFYSCIVLGIEKSLKIFFCAFSTFDNLILYGRLIWGTFKTGICCFYFNIFTNRNFSFYFLNFLYITKIIYRTTQTFINTLVPKLPLVPKRRYYNTFSSLAYRTLGRGAILCFDSTHPLLSDILEA